MKLTECLNNAPYRPKKVLGILRLSSLEFLKNRNPDLSEQQILSKIKEQGQDPEEIVTEHQLQKECEENLTKILKRLDITFRISKRIRDATKCVNWADLVIPIGGDGTFLLASKLITDNKKPVFGINPNVSSKCNIFTLPSSYAADIESIFEKLHSGEYTILMRSRIRTVMNGEGLYTRPFHIHEKSRTLGERRAETLIRSTQRKMADSLQPRRRTLPWLALNEVKHPSSVFMGEFLSARPITLDVKVDNEEYHTIRSSGICVCTGSGCRSWFKSMNLQPADTFQKIVEIATGKKLTEQETNELLYRYRKALVYPPEDLQMTYMIREIYQNTCCSNSKCCPSRQRCNKFTVISRGFDAGIVIDGSISLPFNDGTIASFEINPEYSLKNIILP